ncbi:hypothetical protein Q8A73_018702 [Channa argus]|nr:hypothetical protein Q8A73_018702 [Channa argus]
MASGHESMSRLLGGAHSPRELSTLLPIAPCGLVRRPTAGKTEFVKSELPLMRKNTDPYPSHRPANQKTDLLPEQRRQQSGEAAVSMRVHMQTAENRAVQGQTDAHALSPVESAWVSGCVWLACVHICVCIFLLASSQLSPCSPCVHLCVRMCVRPPGGSCSLLTIRQRMQTTNKSLISSFLSRWHRAYSNPRANAASTGRWGWGVGRVGGGSESNLWSVCLEKRWGKKKSDGVDELMEEKGGTEEQIEREGSMKGS